MKLWYTELKIYLLKTNKQTKKSKPKQNKKTNQQIHNLQTTPHPKQQQTNNFSFECILIWLFFLNRGTFKNMSIYLSTGSLA